MRLLPVVRAGIAALVAVGAAAACQRGPTCDPKDRVNLDFKVQDAAGRQVDLAAYRGKPLLINFWATWCGPCKEEIPALVELAAKYASSGFTIVGISVDDTPADLQKFAAANKVNYPLLTSRGNDELLEAYDAQIAVPITWFVAPNGCPSARKAGAATKDWFDQQIKALL